MTKDEGLYREAQGVIRQQQEMFDQTYREGEALGVHKRGGESFLECGKRVKDASCAVEGGHDWESIGDDPDRVWFLCGRCGRSMS